MQHETNTTEMARPEKRGLVKRLVTSELCETFKVYYVPYHAYFFAFYGGIGALLLYLTLYFKQLGLSAAQAGVLAAIRPLSEVFVPLWGWVGDKYQQRKTILQLAIVSYTVSTLLVLTVQPRYQKCVESEGNMTRSSTLKFSQSGVRLRHSRPGHDSSANADAMIQNNSVPPIYQREMDQKELDDMFAIILLITVLGQIVGCVVFSFPEALLVAFLEDKVHKFGSIRFWGEISVSISSFTVGAALYITETHICGQLFKNYSIAFYSFTAFMAAALLITIWMKTKPHDPRPEIGLKEVLSIIVTSLKSISVLVTTVGLGSFTGMTENFGLWFLEDLGGSSLLIGVATGVRYLLAIIGYITSPYFIAYFGVVRVLIATTLSHGIVFCGISLMRIPGAALIFHVLQGLLYSLSWCAVITQVGHISQETGYTASIQGVYSGTFWGLGYGAGTMLSGVMVQELGIRITYQTYAAAAFGFCFLLIAVYRLTERRNNGKDDVPYELISEEKHEEDETGGK